MQKLSRCLAVAGALAVFACEPPPTPTPPGAPQQVQGSSRGDGFVLLTWNAPAGGDPASGYRIRLVGSAATLKETSETWARVDGLANGTDYSFVVHAFNSAGEGPSSEPSAAIRPARVPDAPTSALAAAGNRAATISWSAPASDGGEAIVTYRVVAMPGGREWTTGAANTSLVAVDLQVGTTYTFAVSARNAMGEGAAAQTTDIDAVGAPSAPQGVIATRGDQSAVVSWTEPTDTGGLAVLDYEVAAFPDGPSSVVAGALSATIGGLTNGMPYTFWVRARNSAGSGPWSSLSAFITPARVPDAPQSVGATAGDRSATVSWLPPANDGGATVTHYHVFATPGALEWAASGVQTSLVASGLSAGTEYRFTVTAENEVGQSAASGESAPLVAVTGPGAPAGVTAVRGNGSIQVTWTAPAGTGGLAIDDYAVSIFPGGSTVTVSGAESYTATDLTDGVAYYFTVRARNAVGLGPWSAPSSSIVAAHVPGAPSLVSVERAARSITVTWEPPSNDGGDSIASYRIVATPGGAELTTGASARSATFDSLVLGISYELTVAAVNALGEGEASQPSAPTVFVDVPGAPEALAVTGGDSSATLSWTPGTSGGDPNVRHRIVSDPPGVDAETSEPTFIATDLRNGVRYRFDVWSENAVGASPHASATGQAHAAVEIVSTGIPSRAGGCIEVPYSIRRSSPGYVDVSLAYSIAGNPFRPVTPGWIPGSEGGRRRFVDSSAPGTSHLFAWDSLADLATRTEAQALVRIRARPSEGGASTEMTVPMALDQRTTFGAASAFVSPNPLDEAIAGDFDRNGTLDLAATSQASGTVEIFLNDGTGALSAAHSLAAAAGILGIASGDFDRNGVLDLVTTSEMAGAVLLHRGAGDGSFDPVTTIATGGSPGWVRADDFDADGDLDLVIADAASGSISVLLGNGDGTFTAAAPLALGATPARLEVADFDLDGDRDLAVLTTTPDELRIYRGLANGAFALWAASPVGGSGGLTIARWPRSTAHTVLVLGTSSAELYSVYPSGAISTGGNLAAFAGVTSLAAGDLHRQGRPDIVVGSATQSALDLFEADASGYLSPVQPAVPGPSSSLLVADMDRDGAEDVVAVGGSGGYVVRQATPMPCMSLFNMLAEMPFDNGMASLVSGDFDADGRADFAFFTDRSTTSNYQHGFQSALNRGTALAKGPFLERFFPPFEQWDLSAQAADLEGDGHDELMTGSQAYRLDPTDTFVAVGPPLPWPLTFAEDLDLDGRAELARRETDGLALYRLDSTGAYVETARVALPATAVVGMPGDVEGDGLKDILGWDGASLFSARNLGASGFAALVWHDLGGFVPSAISTGDLTGDGLPDLAIETTCGLVVMRGDGSGAFERIYELFFGTCIAGVKLADFDADGVLDLAAEFGGEADILRGIGNGTFGPVVASLPSTDIGLAADFDGDERGELATIRGAHSYVGAVLQLRLDQPGGFDGLQSVLVGQSVKAAKVGDLNRDGYADLVAVGSTDVVAFLGPNYSQSFAIVTPLQDAASGIDRSCDFYWQRDGDQGVVLADFDGDGIPDLFLKNMSGSFGWLLRGLGDGTFHPAETVPTTWPFSDEAFAAADVNRDGKLDLVSACGSIQTLLGAGDGTFTEVGPGCSGATRSSLVLADFTGDGILDAAYVDGYGARVDSGLGDGTFTPIWAWWITQNVGSVAVADFNRDGRMDLAAAGSGIAGLVGINVFLGDGSGGFAGPIFYSAGAHPGSIRASDLNRDGNVDLAIVDEGNAPSQEGVNIMLGHGDGTFDRSTGWATLGSVIRSVIPTDIEGDPRPELVVVQTDRISILSQP